jgi:hypothetical protein
MSTDTNTNIENTPAETGGAPSQGQADGSPPPNGPGTQDAGVTEGASKEAAEQGTVPDSAEVSRLMAEISRRDEELQRARDMLDTIDADPVASKEAHRAVRGLPPQAEGGRIEALAREKFGNLDEQGAWAKALTEFGNTIREDTLAEVERRIGPRIQGLDRTLSGSKFEKAMVAGGVDPSAPEVRAFVKEQMASDRTFKTLYEKAPDTAAELAVARFSARNGNRAVAAAERKRTDLARGAGLNSRTPRGTTSASDTFKVKRFAPDRAARLVELINKGVDVSQVDFE